ncbi:MAG: ABC transporter ATP-binding protein, partial [Pseudomonadota bacterium]
MVPSSLKIDDVTLRFGRQYILNDLNFEVLPGQVVCLLGPSGCGKTTALRVIAGLESPDQGDIFINGLHASSPSFCLSPEKRQIGMVFQDYALFPHLNVEENIGFGVTVRDHKKATIDHLLESMQLEAFRKDYPHTLSGGQQQRVALARAIANKPRLMLLDEPFSSLDPRLRNHICDNTLHLLKQQNIPCVIVTHNAEEAMYIADIIAVMRNGCIEQIGKPEDIYLNPKNAFVASFLSDVNQADGWFENGFIKSPLGYFNAKNINIAPEFYDHLIKSKSSSPVRLVIRPENLLLDQEPSSISKGSANTAKKPIAHVITSKYLGRTSLIHLYLKDHPEVHLHARMLGCFLPREGTRQSLTLDE